MVGAFVVGELHGVVDRHEHGFELQEGDLAAGEVPDGARAAHGDFDVQVADGVGAGVVGEGLGYGGFVGVGVEVVAFSGVGVGVGGGIVVVGGGGEVVGALGGGVGEDEVGEDGVQWHW